MIASTESDRAMNFVAHYRRRKSALGSDCPSPMKYMAFLTRPDEVETFLRLTTRSGNE
ncbi:MAG TPA: hypothetical protein VGE62_01835 [Candidatus Paceibacterota bacterium]